MPFVVPCSSFLVPKCLFGHLFIIYFVLNRQEPVLKKMTSCKSSLGCLEYRCAKSTGDRLKQVNPFASSAVLFGMCSIDIVEIKITTCLDSDPLFGLNDTSLAHLLI